MYWIGISIRVCFGEYMFEALVAFILLCIVGIALTTFLAAWEDLRSTVVLVRWNFHAPL